MKNRIINGAMNIDQNKEGEIYYSNPNLEIYSLDQWRFFGGGGTGSFSMQRVAIPDKYKGFKYALQASVTAPQSSIGSVYNYHIEYPIEGIEMIDWKYGTAEAKTVTVSFYIIVNVDGDYSFAFMNGTNDRSYTTSFNIPVANAWNKVEITIPGDTAGSWSTSECTFGLKMLWSLGACNLCSTINTEAWQGSATWNKTGTQQLITQGYNKNMYITGVQVEFGTEATEYEFLEPHVELAQAQKYFWKSFPNGTPVGQNKGASGSINYIAQNADVNGNGVQVTYPRRLTGSPPTFTFFSPGKNDGQWYNQSSNTSSGAPSAVNSSVNGFFLYNPQVSGDAKGAVMNIHIVANARLGGN